MRLLTIVLITLCIRGAIGAEAPTRDFAWQGETMGTTYSIKIARTALTDSKFEQLKVEVENRLIEVNRQMSHYQTNSELSQFNNLTSTAPFKVAAGFAMVTRFAIELNRASDGVFDPTLGPLINVWGFGQQGDRFTPPPAEQVAQARKVCGCQHLRVTETGELQKDLPQLQLNLSAVAKGFGVDEVARVIRDHGITNVFVEIGGEVVAYGLSPRQQPWRVGVEAPNPAAFGGDDLAAIISVSNQAIATSGDYRRFYEDAQGRLYSHIIDPRTGTPVHHRLHSVSVVADTCLRADGVATTLFVLGEKEGLRWIEQHPKASALFIVREADGQIRKIASSRFPKWVDTRGAAAGGGSW